jgi:hypothetical protein
VCSCERCRKNICQGVVCADSTLVVRQCVAPICLECPMAHGQRPADALLLVLLPLNLRFVHVHLGMLLWY